MKNYIISRIDTHYGLIQISGNNNKIFLNGQLSIDVIKLKPYQAKLGCYCNIKGRIECVFYAMLYQDDILLMMPHELLNAIIKELNVYASFSKVKIQINYDLKIYAFLGEITNKELPLIMYQCKQKQLAIGLTLKSLTDTLTNIKYFEYESIVNRIPMIYSKTQSVFLPHYIGLHKLDAIDFKKGCYRGQEIIARMQYRVKKFKYQSYILNAKNIQELPEVGDNLIDQNGKKLGIFIRITSFNDEYFGLAELPVNLKQGYMIKNQKQQIWIIY